jgi:hypothetical protein
MRRCSGCCGEVDSSFRFCPWCAAPQRRKLTEFFGPHPAIGADRGRALRVSRYIAPDALRHVRFSIWGGGARMRRVEAAVSLDEDEAKRLARFLVLDAEAEAETACGEDTQPSICG